MKKITTLTVSALAGAMLLATGCSTNNGNQETATPSVSITEQSPATEKVGYSLGFMMAEGNKDAVKDLDLDTFEQGFRDGYEGNDSALTQEQMQEVLTTYQKEQEEKFVKDMQSKAEENKTKGAAFLAENAEKDGVKTTATGLQYKMLTAGTGKSPKPTDVVEVNYEGKLIDGTVFDSSYERGEPIEFPLNQVIAGWTEGLQLMKEGGKYEFYIPSDIAYGEAGNSGIEPNSTLIFTVELLKVKAK
ncbi:FKBP-type peptidyl-prolyl cis-trans isomerase [Psychrobacter sp. LV10R520-6]|uniref:FKBP-type peptidyl-prolyl cis-trans isomerase n=1 Tax=Psychrobacter sp. LV10R520-6 TaxID=1415574 RepID=UPI0024CD770A|nr:FKBP-type peptidyl-prolyl cis-trans isomerase [Psychrobacter sp. LV10R520-6]SNT70989.1 FKBP-type peptidyl-prolyl cis-trans isomerase FklB [Psychrobacter sp. LV10R520-6]